MTKISKFGWLNKDLCIIEWAPINYLLIIGLIINIFWVRKVRRKLNNYSPPQMISVQALRIFAIYVDPNIFQCCFLWVLFWNWWLWFLMKYPKTGHSWPYIIETNHARLWSWHNSLSPKGQQFKLSYYSNYYTSIIIFSKCYRYFQSTLQWEYLDELDVHISEFTSRAIQNTLLAVHFILIWICSFYEMWLRGLPQHDYFLNRISRTEALYLSQRRVHLVAVIAFVLLKLMSGKLRRGQSPISVLGGCSARGASPPRAATTRLLIPVNSRGSRAESAVRRVCCSSSREIKHIHLVSSLSRFSPCWKLSPAISSVPYICIYKNKK